MPIEHLSRTNPNEAPPLGSDALANLVAPSETMGGES